MPKIPSIEGARGWLAWFVVFSHLGQFCNIASYSGHWVWLAHAGSIAVKVFIAISGFVICNVVLERRESWLRYIIRRAFRIFPAYWAAYALTLAVFPLALATLPLLPSLDDPHFAYDEQLQIWADAMHQHLWPILGLHTVLLQGLVPESVWPGAMSATMPQAWSLTLEWQFYLIAPVLIWLLMSKRWRLLTALALIAGAFLFKRGVFGVYYDPAFFPGSAYIFLIGIASRLWLPDLKQVSVAPSFVVCTLALGLFFFDLLWLAMWIALLGYIISHQKWDLGPAGTAPARAPSALGRIMRAALESPAALYLGARSYSVYLLHVPMLQIALWLVVSNAPGLERYGLAAAVSALSIPLIIVTSDLLYRVVERPMIAFGARLARGRADAPQPLAPSSAP